MFTRFKSLSMVFFFLLSFILVTFFWGENGYFARKTMEKNLETLNSYAEEREMELSLLRERNEAERGNKEGNLELVYSFDDDGAISTSNGLDGLLEDSGGLKWWECALYALVATIIYSVLIIVVPLLLKKKKGKSKETETNGCDN